MLFADLSAQKDKIKALASQYGARHIRVFGSVARGEESADSDIDFLVDLPKGYDLFTQRIRLTQSLEDFLGRKVDLVPEHELNQHIRAIVLQEAREL
jgi:predicted nucleotidyltransferase